MFTIMQFKEKYAQDVIDIVLYFQNDGTRPNVSVADQPDILNIKTEYIDKCGNFWFAVYNDDLIGTIGLMPFTEDTAVLKKVFCV